MIDTDLCLSTDVLIYTSLSLPRHTLLQNGAYVTLSASHLKGSENRHLQLNEEAGTILGSLSESGNLKL